MSLSPIPGYEPNGYGNYGDASPPPASPPAPSPSPAPAPLVMPQAALMPTDAAPTVDPGASMRAGTAVVIAGAGLGAGALLGGLWGAGSGLFFSGALLNAWRARALWGSSYADDRAEAIKTTVMAVVGVAAGGYLGYKAKQSKDGDE